MVHHNTYNQFLISSFSAFCTQSDRHFEIQTDSAKDDNPSLSVARPQYNKTQINTKSILYPADDMLLLHVHLS